MSIRKFTLPEDSNINTIISIAADNLTMQGYDVKSQIIGPTAAEVIVSKDRDGLKNILGLGIESRVAVTITGNELNVAITDEWTNKIIAAAVGFFVCWISFVTGIVGLINQSTLPEKINTAFNLAVNSGYRTPPPAPPTDDPNSNTL